MAHYLIVGSGLIGRLLAWRLLREDHQVDILSRDDREGSDSAGHVAAAMVAPSTEAVHTEAMVKHIGHRSLSLWPQWLAELPQPIYYQQPGTLVVAHQGDQAEFSRYQLRASHMLESDDFDTLDKQQLLQREPQLAEQFDKALYFHNEAFLDNRQLYTQLQQVLDHQQCHWQQCDTIEHLDKNTISLLTQRYFNKDRKEYDAVIDCRGHGAQADLPTLRSVRGEILRIHAPDVSINHAVRLLHPRYPLYLVPRADHHYILGATVIESDDRSPVSVRSALELLSALYSLHKGFSEARILEMVSHCRPALTDNMPSIIGTDWGYRLNGFYRHGYLFAPAIIDDFIALLKQQQNTMHFEQYYQRYAYE